MNVQQQQLLTSQPCGFSSLKTIVNRTTTTTIATNAMLIVHCKIIIGHDVWADLHKEVQANFKSVFLNKLGFPRTFQLPVAFGPKELGGVGFMYLDDIEVPTIPYYHVHHTTVQITKSNASIYDVHRPLVVTPIQPAGGISSKLSPNPSPTYSSSVVQNTI